MESSKQGVQVHTEEACHVVFRAHARPGGSRRHLLAQQGGFVPVEALRAGGYVLLFRYTTVQLVQEPSPIDLANCAVQHRLTDQGREVQESESVG